MDFLKFKKKKYFETFSNEMHLRNFQNLLELYLPEQTGSILDIGCGQSPSILSMIQKPFKFVAVDSDLDELTWLKKRIESISEKHLEKVELINDNFRHELLGDKIFDGIVLSNILHFFTLEEAIMLVHLLQRNMRPGSIVVATVHSNNHPIAKLNNPTNFFKHFFSHDDLRILFKTTDFDYLYTCSTSAEYPIESKKFTMECLQEYYSMRGASNDKFLHDSDQYFRNNKTESISLVVSKK